MTCSGGGGGGGGVGADRPGVSMFESDPLLRCLSCHFGSLRVSSLWCSGVFFIFFAPTGGTEGGHVLEVTAPPSLPHFPTYRHSRQDGDHFNTLVGSAAVAPSVSSISLSARLGGPPRPSISAGEINNKEKRKKKKTQGRPLVLHMLNFIQIVRHLRTDKTLSPTPRHSLCCQRR